MKALILAYPYEVFTVLTILGAIYHWIQKAAKGEASFNPVDYWLKESPGYTAGTLVALIVAWWGVVSMELLEGVKWQLIVGAGIMCGYTLNSGISAGAQAAAAAAPPSAKAAGFVRMQMLPLLLVLSALAACASFGLPSPKTTGQSIVQAYGDATSASAMIPGLLASNTLSAGKAQEIVDAAKTVHETIDVYWDGFGILVQCRQAAATPNKPAPPECAGPQGLFLLNSINQALLKVTAFLIAHKE